MAGVSALELETIAAPRALGDDALVPTAEALASIADQIDEMELVAGVFGLDETGTALVDAYRRVQSDTSDRITADQEAITSAAAALTKISANYQAMLEANTPQGR